MSKDTFQALRSDFRGFSRTTKALANKNPTAEENQNATPSGFRLRSHPLQHRMQPINPTMIHSHRRPLPYLCLPFYLERGRRRRIAPGEAGCALVVQRSFPMAVRIISGDLSLILSLSGPLANWWRVPGFYPL